MEGSSNANMSSSTQIQDSNYLYASNTNVSNFVSIKLSGESNYLLWKAQMLCLLDSNNMGGLVDDAFGGTRDFSTDTMRQYNSLVKGWIFGSVTENILIEVFNLDSAKAVWEKLKSICDPTLCLREGKLPSYRGSRNTRQFFSDTTSSISFAKTNTIEEEEEANAVEVIVGKDTAPTETETKNDGVQNSENNKKELYEFTIKGNWSKVEAILKKDEGLATEAISSDGSTILHIAVGIGHNDFVEKLFSYVKDEQIVKTRNSDGTTPLHIAAIVGNKHAAELLVKKNHNLLQIEDHKGDKPLRKAYENMHLHTIGYLLKAMKDDGKSEVLSSLADSVEPGDEIGVVDFLVNAISAKHYHLALDMLDKFPHFASKSDEVLMAIAKTFPSGLHNWERLIYPSLNNTLGLIAKTAVLTVFSFGLPVFILLEFIFNSQKDDYNIGDMLCAMVMLTVPGLLASPFLFICLLTLVVYFIFLFLYFLWWNVAKLIPGPIKHIENKKKEWSDAKKVLKLVCKEIDELGCSGTHHPFYTQPLLEAACNNAYKVVVEILSRSPQAIQSTDKNGYDIIQLAIIKRSEKIYNLIYDIGERKNLYRTCKDSFGNNILHLAGKLAPSSVLNQRRGAALQLQRELQWCEDVKKFVFPTYITQENIFKDTPDMIFRREHENLVKEGEKWMKTTAESCSITAALIATIVFAAAITVPGGSDGKEGIPLFRKKTVFIIFAISDAISLFASTTALLVFLSILTARFAEKDFLVSLPSRLFIGLFSLLLSTTTMMVAFSSILFLVFCEEKLWTLAPICGLALIPIVFFVGLQFPLMVDLFRSTYIRIFGKQRKNILGRFNPNEIRLRFGINIEGNNLRAAMREKKKRNDKQGTQLAKVQTKRHLQQ